MSYRSVTILLLLRQSLKNGRDCDDYFSQITETILLRRFTFNVIAYLVVARLKGDDNILASPKETIGMGR